MKKLITSASLVALGAVGVQAQSSEMTSAAQKPWSVSAALRGFWDDNYTTSPSAFERESFGFELRPSAAYNFSNEQTRAGVAYVYGLKWYEDRKEDEFDQSHQFNANLTHAFTERYRLDVSDSFVIAQEPEVLDPEGGPVTTLLRSEGDNIRNQATVSLTVTLTETLSTVFGYSNTFYNYEEEAGDTRTGPTGASVVVGPGSRSALLDRMEHLFSTNLRWQMLQRTVGVLGYQYKITDYTSNDPLTLLPFGTDPDLNDPDIRNKSSHYFFVGADQTFNQQLSGSLRVGAQAVNYESESGVSDRLDPYVDGNLTYTYTTDSYVQIGVRHEHTETDIAYLFGGAGAIEPTVDARSTSIYGSLNHSLTAKVVASLLATYQHSTFEGGVADGETEDLFMAGLNLSYYINEFLAAEAGYSYDRLASDLSARDFSRNRVFVGLRATY